MNLTILDHLFGLLLALALPLLGAWQFRRLEARLAAGEADVRIGQYRAVVVEEVLATGAVLALWLTLDRPWELLAPAAPVSWSWLGAAGWAATAVLGGLLLVQAVALGRDEGALAPARRQMEPMAAFLPHTRRELRGFRVLSVTAGVGEEVVFRGFSMAWLAALASSVAGLGPGAALGTAMLGSSVLFGLAHAYQGTAGIVKTGAVGLILAAVAVATGGLLAPVLLHVVVDLTSGQVAYLAFGTDDRNDRQPVPA